MYNYTHNIIAFSFKHIVIFTDRIIERYTISMVSFIIINNKTRFPDTQEFFSIFETKIFTKFTISIEGNLLWLDQQRS